MTLLDHGAAAPMEQLLIPSQTSVSAAGTRAASQNRCRTNSRHGLTDPSSRSYPPVEAVCRALDVLRAVNKVRIASVNDIYRETAIPKSTIVRMLETLMGEGYVARDNLCGGYRVTCRVNDLTSGYAGISQVIEVSRLPIIELTRLLKWPIEIGVIDGDAIAIQFWTGTISPWAYTDNLGLRADLLTTSMGRSYLAYCPPAELDMRLARFRKDPSLSFGESEERRFRLLIDRARRDGYAMRDPRTKPYRTATLAMPILDDQKVLALISVSFFKTAVQPGEIAERIVAPLRATISKIEAAFTFMRTGRFEAQHYPDDIDARF